MSDMSALAMGHRMRLTQVKWETLELENYIWGHISSIIPTTLVHVLLGTIPTYIYTC